MSTPPPQPVSHTTEMVVATVIGAAVGLTTGKLMLGAGVGIVVGIVLSVAKTLYVERQRRRR